MVAREFVGRHCELGDLAEKLKYSDRVAITAVSGMGGIGKTALAQQYVRETKETYPGGRWYFKVRDQNLVTQLVSAAARFGWELPDDMTDSREQAQWCYERWCYHYPGPRLLLLDDVQAYNDVKHLLPQDDDSFRVLMTSRQRFEKPVDRLDLDVLPLGEAMVLLIRLVGDEDRVTRQQSEAEALCEWVGRLPLGIELIARYLALHPNTTFAKLQERLNQKRLQAKALNRASDEVAYDQLQDYEAPIQAAFELSWQDLVPEAKTLMGLLSVFAAAPISKELIEGALPEWDEEDLEDGLDVELVRRNLLQSDVDGSYELHQLIREFTVSKLETELSAETSVLQKGVANSLVNFAKQIQQTVTINAQQVVSAVVPHMVLVARELSHSIEDSTDSLGPFFGLGLFYENQSLWPEAEHWFKACLDMTEERFGSDHPDTATSLNNLALLYRSMGRYAESAPLLSRALAIIESQLGPDHPDTATSLNNLAGLYESMGRYAESAPLLSRALAIIESQLGPDHPSTATSLNNLAGLYRSMGRYAESAPLYSRALAIRESQLGPDHPDTATSLNNLAGLYASMGRYAESAPLFSRALAIIESQLGPDHPSTATSLNNLAGLYRSMGRYAESEPLYSRALAIRESQLGPDHPSTATSLNNLASLYASMGHFREAETMYLRSLEIKQNVLPPDHPSMKRGNENFCYFVQQVIETNQTEQLSDHPLTQAILKNLQSQ